MLMSRFLQSTVEQSAFGRRYIWDLDSKGVKRLLQICAYVVVGDVRWGWRNPLA